MEYCLALSFLHWRFQPSLSCWSLVEPLSALLSKTRRGGPRCKRITEYDSDDPFCWNGWFRHRSAWHSWIIPTDTNARKALQILRKCSPVLLLQLAMSRTRPKLMISAIKMPKAWWDTSKITLWGIANARTNREVRDHLFARFLCDGVDCEYFIWKFIYPCSPSDNPSNIYLKNTHRRNSCWSPRSSLRGICPSLCGLWWPNFPVL